VLCRWKAGGTTQIIKSSNIFSKSIFIFSQGTGAAWGDLFIDNITYAEAGIYKCIARTPQDEAAAEANVTVIGKTITISYRNTRKADVYDKFSGLN
jgi:hypothetical protein